MNQLVVIGNGFDLAHGLRTSYTDFILWYLNNITRYEREHREFDKEVDLAWIHYQYYNSNPSSTIKEYFDRIQRDGIGIKYNEFFKTIMSEFKEYNWVDIEKLYFDELVSIIYRQVTDQQYKLAPYYVEQVRKLNHSLSLMKKYLEVYLSKIDEQEIKYLPDIQRHLNDVIKCTISGARESIHILNFNYTSTIRKYFHAEEFEIEIGIIL